MNIDIEVISTATSILAKFPFCIRLGNSFLQGNIFVVVFSTNVDVSSLYFISRSFSAMAASNLGEHGSTNNQTSVHLNQMIKQDNGTSHAYQLVRLMPENLSVLACAGFTLIGVHHKIRGSGGRMLSAHTPRGLQTSCYRPSFFLGMNEYFNPAKDFNDLNGT